MPVMCSCRNALILAIQVRTLRYDSRTLRRNHCVTSAISGSTVKAIAARRQSMIASAPMIPISRKMSPNTDTTPAVKSSLSTSTSVVTRVISRPTGFLSKYCTSIRCRCP